MRRGAWRVVAAAAAWLVACGSATVARAAPNEADVALARELAIAGISAADAGDCAGAVPTLDRAARLYAAPTILGRLGECHVALGHLVVGTEILQRVVREPLTADASTAFVKAKERARTVLDAALPKIARVTVHLTAPPGAKVAVTLDGQPLSDAALEVARPVDPGTHALKATAPGYHTASAEVTVGSGEAGSVMLTLTPDSQPPPPPAAAVVTRAAPADGTPRTRGRVRPTWQVVLPWAVTGAFAAGAGVTGALALSASGDLDRALGSFPVTQSKLTSTQNRAVAFAAATDALAGAAVVAGGIAIYFTATRTSNAPTSATGPRLVAAPGALRLEGSF